MAIQSAAMIREILVLFTDKEEPELLSAGKKLYNNMIQEVASELLELCFIDEKVWFFKLNKVYLQGKN